MGACSRRRGHGLEESGVVDAKEWAQKRGRICDEVTEVAGAQVRGVNHRCGWSGFEWDSQMQDFDRRCGNLDRKCRITRHTI